MEWLYIILFVLLVFLFWILLSFFFLLLDIVITILVVGIPGIVFSLFVLFVIKFIYPIIVQKRLQNNKNLSQIISLNLRGSRVEKKINIDMLKKKISTKPVFYILVFPFFILFLIYYYHPDITYFSVYAEHVFFSESGVKTLVDWIFRGGLISLIETMVPIMKTLRISPGPGLCLVTSLINSLGIFSYFKPKSILLEAVKEKLAYSIERVETVSVPKIKEIYQIQDRMKKLAHSRDCEFDPPYVDQVKKKLKENSEELVMHPSHFTDIAEWCKKQAENDLKKMKQSFASYDEVLRLTKTTVKVVNRTGSSSFISEMDEMVRIIKGPRLLELIMDRKWDDFEDIISSIKVELHEIKQGAKRYINSGKKQRYEQEREYKKEESKSSTSKGKRQDDQSEKEDTVGEKMTEKKALEILNLPSGTSFKDIREQYKKLIRVWHPDHHNKDKDDKELEKIRTRWQKIKKAFDFLADQKRGK